jgi:hypothetical protein
MGLLVIAMRVQFALHARRLKIGAVKNTRGLHQSCVRTDLSTVRQHMRRVKLPDLLIEVDDQLGFSPNFLTPAQREPECSE